MDQKNVSGSRMRSLRIALSMLLTALLLLGAFGGAALAKPGDNPGKPGGPVKEQKPGLLKLHQGAYAIKENQKWAAVTVHRVGGADGEVTVDYCLCSGTAQLGTDYEGLTGTLTFKDGEKSKLINIRIVDDKVKEENEYFFIKLKNATGGAQLSEPSKAKIIIQDDDKK